MRNCFKFFGIFEIFGEDFLGDLFVKILVFVKILSQGKKEGRRKKISILRSASSSISHLKTECIITNFRMYSKHFPFTTAREHTVERLLLKFFKNQFFPSQNS